jgi:hypothetical protein
MGTKRMCSVGSSDHHNDAEKVGACSGMLCATPGPPTQQPCVPGAGALGCAVGSRREAAPATAAKVVQPAARRELPPAGCHPPTYPPAQLPSLLPPSRLLLLRACWLQAPDTIVVEHGGVHLNFEAEGTSNPVDSPSLLYVTVRRR